MAMLHSSFLFSTTLVVVILSHLLPVSSVSNSTQWIRHSTPNTGETVFTDVHVILSQQHPDSLLGYVSGELGTLIKLNTSIDTAIPTWSYTNLPVDPTTYPYGVYAFPDETTVMLAGFVDSSSDDSGFIQYSRDAGNSWENRTEVGKLDWCNGPITLFDDQQHGILPSGAGLILWVTKNGGKQASDWLPVKPDPVNGGWHSGDYLTNSSGYVKIVGATDCTSYTYGQTWVSPCPNSIDPDADGGISCYKNICTIGGGEISPNVSGWVHLSMDGGNTWAQRVLNSPFPIRTVEVVGDWISKPPNTPPLLIAAGGNFFSRIGGVFTSIDNGKTWQQDLDTNGEEIKSCRGLNLVRNNRSYFRLYCVSAGQSQGSVYSTDIPL